LAISPRDNDFTSRFRVVIFLKKLKKNLLDFFKRHWQVDLEFFCRVLQSQKVVLHVKEFALIRTHGFKDSIPPHKTCVPDWQASISVFHKGSVNIMHRKAPLGFIALYMILGHFSTKTVRFFFPILKKNEKRVADIFKTTYGHYRKHQTKNRRWEHGFKRYCQQNVETFE